MKKLIKKLENWAEKNPNKCKILSKICDHSYVCFDLIIGFTLIAEARLEGFIMYLEIKFLSLIFSCLEIAIDLFIEKWKEAKEKDRKEN